MHNRIIDRSLYDLNVVALVNSAHVCQVRYLLNCTRREIYMFEWQTLLLNLSYVSQSTVEAASTSECVSQLRQIQMHHNARPDSL